MVLIKLRPISTELTMMDLKSMNNNIVYNPNTITFKAIQDSVYEPLTLMFIDSDVANNKELIKALRKEFPTIEIKVLNYKVMPVEFNKSEYTKAFFNSSFRSLNYIHIDEILTFEKTQKYINQDSVHNIIVDSSVYVEFKDLYLNSFVQNIRINEYRRTPSTKSVCEIVNQRQDMAEALKTIIANEADVSKVAKILEKLK